MKYTCPRCGYSTNQKVCILKHINRKYRCEPLVDKVTPTSVEDCCSISTLQAEKPYSCRHKCGKTFSHTSGESRHQKTCQKKKGDVPMVVGNHNVVGNNNSVNHHNTININIVPFEDSIPKRVGVRKFLDLMRRGALDVVLKMIEEEHFNPEKPEQMNVYVSNLKDKIARVFCDKGFWQVCNADEIKTEVYDRYLSSVNRMIEETAELVENELGQKYSLLEREIRRWQRQTDREEFDEHAKESVKMLLYNLRNIVKTTHNLKY